MKTLLKASLIICTSYLLSYCDKKNSQNTPNQQKSIKLANRDHTESTNDTTASILLPKVTTQILKSKDFRDYVKVQGKVITKKDILIFPEIPGKLDEVYITEGEQVSKNQTLAIVNDGGIKQQLEQAKLQSDLAKTTFERQKRLWEQNIGSEIQYLQTKTAHLTYLNTVKQLERTLKKVKITAPFSGVIDKIITKQGTAVAPGVPLFKLINLDKLYIKAEVSERYLSKVNANSSLEIEIDALKQNVIGKVNRIGNIINPNSRTFLIEAELLEKNNQIKPNLSASIKIETYHNPKAILIPQQCINTNAKGESYVYIIDKKDNKNIAKRQIVTTGRTQDDDIEILMGLKDKQHIITEGISGVTQGQEVDIIIQ